MTMAQRLDIQYVDFCTVGSSALKAAPVMPLKTLALPKRKKLKRVTIRVDLVAAAGILMATVMMILMMVGVSQLVSLRQSEIAMASYVDTLQTENQRLEAEYEAGIQLEEIEKNALALGMIPAEQVQRVSIRIEEPAEESKNVFESLFLLLTGLFA